MAKTKTKKKSKVVVELGGTKRAVAKSTKASVRRQAEHAMVKHLFDYNKIVDEVEKTFRLGSVDLDVKARRANALSTGILSIDLMIGGGILPGGWYTNFGPEQSCVTGDTFVQYRVGANHKGGKVSTLYKRFNGKKRKWSRDTDKTGAETDYYAPSINSKDRVLENRIVDVVYTGKKQCFLVRTKSGHQLELTEDHRMYVGGGKYKELRHLSKGDKLFVHTNTPFKTSKGSAAVSRACVYVKHHPYGTMKIVEGKYEYKQLARSRFVVEANMNGLSTAAYRKRLNEGKLSGLKFLKPSQHVHHKDENKRNDKLQNLEVLSATKHQSQHAHERQDNLRFVVQETTITSIKKTKVQKVYDLEMEAPNHNFIANGIVVHNCKSTMIQHLIASAIDSNVPIIQYFDYEGSFDPNYMQNMLSLHSKVKVDDAFGVRDDKTGKWLKRPKIRTYNEDVAEAFFDSVSSMLRKLPCIEYRNKRWWYVFKNDKNGKALSQGKHDKKLYSETGQLYVEMPENAPKMQGLIIVDSYPSMLPERLDEDDAGSGMAAQARMFSEQIKKVKPKLKKRGVTVVGINQLRQKPGVMYGSPEYEPCGDALKFFSDVRVRQNPRALSAVPGKPKGEGQVQKEKSLFGKGNDEYRFIHLRATKNKLGGMKPYEEAWARLWITDPKRNSYGFDPVYDVFYYLLKTGQLEGNLKKMSINIDKVSIKKIDSYDLKCLILGTGKDLKTTLKRLKLKENPRLRSRCLAQIRSGKAMELYGECVAAGGPKDGEDE